MDEKLLVPQPQEEEQTAPPARRKWGGWKRGKKKKWIALVLVVAVLAGLVGWNRLRTPQVSAQEVSYQEEQVQRRSITNSLSSSGTLEPADSYTVSTLVSAEVLSDTFEEGDLVEEGQLLYTLDASDASSSQTQAQNSYSQAQSSYDQAVEAKYPKADMSGTISEVYVRNGDTVSAGTELLKIVGDNNLYIDFLFAYVDSSDFYVGQTATIFIDGLAGTLTGTVSAVSQGEMVSDNGMMLTTVRVKAVNPGLVTASYTASASIGNYVSYGESPIEISESSVVTAQASGKISGLNFLAGDPISSGDQICTITGDSVDNQIENAKINLENAQSNVQSVEITADAVEGKTYTGTVTSVSVAGTTAGGITTYPVTVRIDETDGLLPGMNVDAQIVLSQADDVLAIPSGAVNRGDTVLITADSPSAANALDQEAPEGYVYVSVETGVSDDSYIEILSGLQEGDTVAYLASGSSGGAMMMDGAAMGGMPGSMGGGMSGGPGGGGGAAMGGGPGGGF